MWKPHGDRCYDPAMLTIIIAWLLSVPSASDVEALRRYAPQDLTLETAQDHLFNARIAARIYRVDADLVLAIAYHESHFTITVTQEHDGLTSCGVMTPEPLVDCKSSTLLDGYMAGAAHLKMWITSARGNMRTALLGYAGGYRMINACAAGPVLRHRGGRDVDICGVSDWFLSNASYIKKLRTNVRAL